MTNLHKYRIFKADGHWFARVPYGPVGCFDSWDQAANFLRVMYILKLGRVKWEDTPE